MRQVGEEGKNILLERFLITSFFFGHNGSQHLRKSAAAHYEDMYYSHGSRCPRSQVPGSREQVNIRRVVRGECGNRRAKNQTFYYLTSHVLFRPAHRNGSLTTLRNPRTARPKPPQVPSNQSLNFK